MELVVFVAAAVGDGAVTDGPWTEDVEKAPFKRGREGRQLEKSGKRAREGTAADDGRCKEGASWKGRGGA